MVWSLICNSDLFPRVFVLLEILFVLLEIDWTLPYWLSWISIGSGGTECRRVQNNEYVLPENDPQEDEVRGYLLRDDINAKTEGAEPAEQG